MNQNMDKVKTTPKDFFLHLGVILSLYVSTVGLLRLLFQIIDIAFPDPAFGFGHDIYSTEMRWWIASLIIVFPIYIFLSWILERDYQAVPVKREVGVRKWLVYITLFIAGIAIIIDLVALLNTFLGGEITTRFILKVLVVLVVAGAVFGYYFYDLQRQIGVSRGPRNFAILVSVGILASLVGGFIVMGSPIAQRYLRLDQDRIQHLSSIQWEIVNYWQDKKVLPAALDDLKEPLRGFVPPVDPETREPYGYERIGPRSFKLCANFRLVAAEKYMSTVLDGVWAHGAGKHCFERTIDPERFAPGKQINGVLRPPQN